MLTPMSIISKQSEHGGWMETNKMKRLLIKKLTEIGRPIIAEMLKTCEFENIINDGSMHLTIKMYTPNDYFYEFINSKNNWPMIHDFITEIVERDFTLNITLDPTRAQYVDDESLQE
jgi:hypothetical protein